MQVAAAAMLKLARDPRYLGAATPGLLAVLHTWTRAMLYHPHVHLLVTSGGISDDGAAWLKAKHRRFLLPERPLSTIFLGNFRHRLKNAGLYTLVPKTAWEKSWVVDCKPAGRGEKVLDYLGRYLFRIAITNSRLDQLSDDGTVRFHYRDNQTGDLKTTTLSAEQFIGRFLAHVLPERFIKVRYSGLFSSCNRLELPRFRRHLTAWADKPGRERSLRCRRVVHRTRWSTGGESSSWLEQVAASSSWRVNSSRPKTASAIG